MMNRTAVFSAVCMIAFSVSAAEPAVSPSAVAERVSSSGGALSWDGIRLGMTLDEVQTLIGKNLTLSPGSEGVKTIDRYAASIVQHGVKVDLSFESDNPAAALVFIRAGFPAGEKVDAPALIEKLKIQAPALAAVDGSVALMMPGTDYQVEPREDGLYLGANWLF